MTSTPFIVGLGEGKRASSRVLRPPGGGHTDIFGSEPEAPRSNKRNAAPSTVVEQDEPEPQTETPTNGNAVRNDDSESISDVIQQKEQPTAPLEETKSENDKQTIQPEAVAAQTESRRRGRVPPGGFSSRLW